MSDKMSEVDWANDEAVVRAAIGGGGSCWGGYGNDPKVFRIWSRALPGGTDPSSILLGTGGSPKEAWASARKHSVVAYFDRENRPVIEVEAPKKAVLARSKWSVWAGKKFGAWFQGLGDGETEDAAWLDAASRLTPAAYPTSPMPSSDDDEYAMTPSEMRAFVGLTGSTPAAVAGDAVKMYVGNVEECRWCHFIIELRQRGEGVEWIHATNNRLWCSHEPHFAEPKIADPVGEREGEPIYLVATGSEGIWSSLFRESALKQGVHDVMCTCKRPWGNCESEGVPATVRLLDEPTEWVGHEPFPRFSWGQNFEDGYIDVTRITDTVALASKQSTEGIPERPKATGNFGGNLACNVHDVYSYCDKVEAIISANEAETARWRCAFNRMEAEKQSTMRMLEKRESDSEEMLAAICKSQDVIAQTPALREWGRCSVEHFSSQIIYLCNLYQGAIHTINAVDDRAKASESELSALKLSSARIEEETLRKAAALVADADVVKTSRCFDDGMRTLAAASRSILSLIPTSPESQEGK